jgi:uncharacterized membrane protein YgcG
MKRKLLFGAFIVSILASCSTAYKTGQTPDDVYYSPARAVVVDPVADYAKNGDDYYLRRKVHNYNQWSTIDDYDYWYDSRYQYNNYTYNSFSLGYSSYYFNPYYTYNPYSYYTWSSWYNPIYVTACYKNPKIYTYTSGSNITAYQNHNYNNNSNNYYTPKSSSSYSPNTSNSSSRTFSTPTSSSAGGRSGGFSSGGSSSSSHGRGGH